jgi:hypothetical protein
MVVNYDGSTKLLIQKLAHDIDACTHAVAAKNYSATPVSYNCKLLM